MLLLFLENFFTHMYGLFVCFGFYIPFMKFSLNGDITITDKGLQILTFTLHSWPLSCVGSLVCHTYCDTGHLFIMVISEDLWHSHLLPSILQRCCRYLYFMTKVCPGWDSNTHLSNCEMNALTDCPTAANFTQIEMSIWVKTAEVTTSPLLVNGRGYKM